MSRAKKTPVPSSWLTAESREQGIKHKLERCSSAKSHTQSVANYIIDNEPALHKHVKVLSDCGSWLVYRNYFTENKNRLIKANLCKKHLFCGLCALRRSALQVKAFEPKLDTVLSNDSELVPLLITFTVKNGPDLEERFRHLDSAKKKMIRRRSNARNGRNTDTVLKYLEGGAGSYEFKRGENSKQWNPHIHMVALMKKSAFPFKRIKEGELKDRNRLRKDIYVPLDFENQLRQEWKLQTGDSHMVDVRAIDMENEKDKFGAICESFKYALKLNDLEIEDHVEAAKVLQGRRLQFSFGNLHGVKINADLVDDPEKELQLLPYIDMVFKHADGKYHLEEITDYGEMPEITSSKDKKKKRKIPESTKWDKTVSNWISNLPSSEKKSVDSSSIEHAIEMEHLQNSQLTRPPVESEHYDDHGELIPF